MRKMGITCAKRVFSILLLIAMADVQNGYLNTRFAHQQYFVKVFDNIICAKRV